mmetsp:Transcript_29193/g.84398  ORF Transcript_29193/g.84398 Transcript_29193/m.84398 type:complete len:853 (+) Transcript_29193:942-3500(+)
MLDDAANEPAVGDVVIHLSCSRFVERFGFGDLVCHEVEVTQLARRHVGRDQVVQTSRVCECLRDSDVLLAVLTEPGPDVGNFCIEVDDVAVDQLQHSCRPYGLGHAECVEDRIWSDGHWIERPALPHTHVGHLLAAHVNAALGPEHPLVSPQLVHALLQRPLDAAHSAVVFVQSVGLGVFRHRADGARVATIVIDFVAYPQQSCIVIDVMCVACFESVSVDGLSRPPLERAQECIPNRQTTRESVQQESDSKEENDLTGECVNGVSFLLLLLALELVHVSTHPPFGDAGRPLLGLCVAHHKAHDLYPHLRLNLVVKELKTQLLKGLDQPVAVFGGHTGHQFGEGQTGVNVSHHGPRPAFVFALDSHLSRRLERLGQTPVQQSHGELSVSLLLFDVQQNIARVRVAVEVPVAEHAVCKRIHQPPEHFCELFVGHTVLQQLRRVGDLEALCKFHNDDALRYQAVDQPRNRHLYVGLDECLPGPPLVAALNREIKLLDGQPLPLADDRTEIVPWFELGDNPADGRKVRDILTHDPVDVRVLHFDDHFGAVLFECRSVHLGYRRTRKRRLVERRKEVIERPLQLRLDSVFDGFKGLGGHGVLQTTQLADERFRQGIGSAAEVLPELNPEASECLDVQKQISARDAIPMVPQPVLFVLAHVLPACLQLGRLERHVHERRNHKHVNPSVDHALAVGAQDGQAAAHECRARHPDPHTRHTKRDHGRQHEQHGPCQCVLRDCGRSHQRVDVPIHQRSFQRIKPFPESVDVCRCVAVIGRLNHRQGGAARVRLHSTHTLTHTHSERGRERGLCTITARVDEEAAQLAHSKARQGQFSTAHTRHDTQLPLRPSVRMDVRNRS